MLMNTKAKDVIHNNNDVRWGQNNKGTEVLYLLLI
jgi:hypothetical protein